MRTPLSIVIASLVLFVTGDGLAKAQPCSANRASTSFVSTAVSSQVPTVRDQDMPPAGRNAVSQPTADYVRPITRNTARNGSYSRPQIQFWRRGLFGRSFRWDRPRGQRIRPLAAPDSDLPWPHNEARGMARP